jgi:glycine cleavage system pyridoxal-binding protein P
VYHGPKGLQQMADRVHGLTAVLAAGAKKLGHSVPAAPFFDTVSIKVGDADKVVKTALAHKVRAGWWLGLAALGLAAGGRRCSWWLAGWPGWLDAYLTAGAGA